MPIFSCLYPCLPLPCPQVVLRWGVQRGCAVIPKSENLGRMKDNLAVEGFTLTQEVVNLDRTTDPDP